MTYGGVNRLDFNLAKKKTNLLKQYTMAIKDSELILNPDGSVYHLNLKPEDISDTIIFVGDQDRVEKITNILIV